MPPPRPSAPPRPSVPPQSSGYAPRPSYAPPPEPLPFAAPPSGPASYGRGYPDAPAPPNRQGRRRPRSRPGRATAALCLVLGVGLLGGAAIGSWLTSGAPTAQAAEDRKAETFELAGSLWHSVPVDDLFPRTVQDTSGGPGGAERTWKRIGIAPDTDCASADAFDRKLAKVLTPVGCERLLRATYTDATSTSVTTVGVITTKADEEGMLALSRRWSQESLGDRTDLLPRPLPFPGTVAETFGDKQRASWTVNVHTDAPLVVYAVSGFADARKIAEPQPAAKAVDEDATSSVAEAGLGHDAKGLQAAVDERLGKAADARWKRTHPEATERGDR